MYVVTQMDSQQELESNWTQIWVATQKFIVNIEITTFSDKRVKVERNKNTSLFIHSTVRTNAQSPICRK
jgi:hypothetical protein